jgi:hypothetical protein
LILKSNAHIGTAEVCQDIDLTWNSSPITIHGFLATGGRSDWRRAQLPPAPEAFLARGLNNSPLLEKLAAG